MNTEANHAELLSLLARGDVRSFGTLYDAYATRLYQYVYPRIGEREETEEIVQEIFVALWEKRATLEIHTSLESWLFGAARNRIFSYMRSKRVRRKYAEDFAFFAAQQTDNPVERYTTLADLENSIQTSIASLPAKCRTAFHLSRVEHQPVATIAERMNISKRTVENYLSQALKHLRASLNEFLSL